MINIIDVHKTFGSNKVLKGVNLEIKEGKTLAIIGKSGCGKSVLLKHIVRLLLPDKGKVIVEGKDISELNTKELYSLRTRFGFLFQGAALFDSMTVEENVSLPLVENKTSLSLKEINAKVEEKLELVDLPGIQKLKPAELSGGMKKRVSLARSLITEPDYILYDEPTTGLDPVMSDSIDNLINSLNEQLNVTSIVVTHDMFSVQNVADKVAMMHDGRIYFEGTVNEIINSNDEVIKNFIKRTGFNAEKN
ncbi:MAG: ABC transporter ATP-binding protein [Ignavibacteria bacterium]|jgi:phospholipid/cholesterol/gamma-HCH transport system ATP-binding protein